MTKIHLQEAMMRLPHSDDLATEERKEQVKETMRQAGWMPIPKPLTKEAVGLLVGNSLEAQSWLMSVVRAIERAHGIGEKDE